jgi:hypothetical protein
MNLHVIWSTVARIVPALALLAVADAAQASGENLPHVFTFAAGYRIDAPSPRNFVEYGVIGKCGNDWCMSVERYDSAKLLGRVPTRYTHEMHAPYGAASCFNGPITRPRFDVVQAEKVTLRQDDDGVSVSAGKYRYRWAADAAAANGYKLVDVSVQGTRLEQGVGFAFSSDHALAGDIAEEQIDAKYKGEIYAKTALSGVAGDWEFKPSIIDFRRFKLTENGAVLALTEPGLPAVVKKYGGPMWVQNSIILKRENKSLAPLVQEYGHDFNRDGCFNESGHNKLMLPVGDENVSAIVYIEYTADNERGFPMISVGRYYR